MDAISGLVDTDLPKVYHDSDITSWTQLRIKLSSEPRFFDENAGGLHWTVDHNKPRHLKQLLDLGHPLEQEDEDGQTALNVAARNGYIVCTEMLLDAGANVEARDSCDMTPVVVAAMYGQEETFFLLKEAGAVLAITTRWQCNMLMLACQGGSLSIVNAVIDLFDVGLQDENGESALYHAAYQENVALVQLLLSRGAPVNTMTRWRGTALQEALRTNRYATAQLLIEWGASFDYVDENGRCLTELARTADMLKLLVSMGARPSESQLVDRASRYIRSRLDVTTKKGITVCYSLYRRQHLLSLV